MRLRGQTPATDGVGDHRAGRVTVENARLGDDPQLVFVLDDVPADHPEGRGPATDRPDDLIRVALEAVCDQVAEELRVAFFVGGDAVDQTREHRFGDLRFEIAQIDRVRAFVERHERQGLDLAVRIGTVAAHHMGNPDVFIGDRVEVAGDDQILAQRDGVQVLLSGPAAQPAAPLVGQDEVFDEFAVVAGEVVLGDEHHLEGSHHLPGQGHLRGVPVLPTQEGEVFTVVEGDVIVGVPLISGVQVSRQVIGHDRLKFQGQCVRDRCLCHAVTVTDVNGCRRVGRSGVSSV